MRYVIYRDRANEWRWTLIAGNGRIISDSGEGYHNKQDCLHGIDLNKQSFSAPVYER